MTNLELIQNELNDMLTRTSRKQNGIEYEFVGIAIKNPESLQIFDKMKNEHTNPTKLLEKMLTLAKANLSKQSEIDKFIVFFNSPQFKNLCELFDLSNTSKEKEPKTPLLNEIYPYVKRIQKQRLSPSLKYFAGQIVNKIQQDRTKGKGM